MTTMMDDELMGRLVNMSVEEREEVATMVAKLNEEARDRELQQAWEAVCSAMKLYSIIAQEPICIEDEVCSEDGDNFFVSVTVSADEGHMGYLDIKE